MALPAQTAPGQALSTDDLDGALALVEEEERRGRRYAAGPLAYHLALTLSGAVAVAAVPLGALLRAVDPPLGQPLLVAGLAAAVAFTLLSTLKHEGAPLMVEAVRAAAAAPARRVLLGVGALSLAGGLGWLLYSTLALRAASRPALLLVAWPLAGLVVVTAVYGLREFSYAAQVARLRRGLSARYVAARRAEEPTVTLPPEEVAGLRLAQQRRVQSRLREAAGAFAAEAAAAYGVVISPEASAVLGVLTPEAQAAVYDRLDTLLQAPHPPEARPTPDGAGLTLFDGAHTLTYQVDEAHRRLTVLGVAAPGEATDGG